MNRPTWDEFFLKHCYLAATRSKDGKTKIGAVLVKDKRIISSGYNGFPAKVRDLPERYENREEKYKFICHAEFNACIFCAKNGVNPSGASLYCMSIPCGECAKAAIQIGVSEVIHHTLWPNMGPKWEESIKYTKIMFEEAGISLFGYDGKLGVQGMNDGKIIDV